MELSQLKIFVETARLGSMKKAADSLFLAHSTVSKAISALEEDLGYKLFQRSNNKIELSEAGKVFLPRVQRALNELSAARAEGQDVADLSLKTVNVGCAFDWFIYKGVNEFRQEHEDISINCISANHEALREALLKREMFMAITYEDLTDQELISVPIFPEDSFVVSHRALPNRSGNISLGDCADCSFVVSDMKYEWYQTEQKYFEQAGIRPHISVQGATDKNISRLLTNSESLCILPGHVAHLLSRTQDRLPMTDFRLNYYRLTDSYTHIQLFLTCCRNYRFHSVEQTFYQKLQDVLVDIRDQYDLFIEEKYKDTAEIDAEERL